MDRRRAQRCGGARLEADVLFARYRETRGRVVDVSLTGAFLATSSTPEVGSAVGVVMRPAGTFGGVQLRARVVTVRPLPIPPRPAGIGVSFETPPLDTARRLAELLDELRGEGAISVPLPDVRPTPGATPEELARTISRLLIERGRLIRRVQALERENAVLRAMAGPPGQGS